MSQLWVEAVLKDSWLLLLRRVGVYRAKQNLPFIGRNSCRNELMILVLETYPHFSTVLVLTEKTLVFLFFLLQDCGSLGLYDKGFHIHTQSPPVARL